MIKIKMIGHDYRYEVYHIVSLFYDKTEMLFSCDEEDTDLYSIFDLNNGDVECRIKLNDNKYITNKLNIDAQNKKELKNAIKKTLLMCLKEYTGIDIPWGILVGIRPTKIIHEDLKHSMSDEDIEKQLVEYYNVSKDKAKLSIEVANNEEKFLNIRERHIGVYVGIPFCPTRCIYCSFTSNPVAGNSKLVDEYLKNLVREIETSLLYAKEKNIKVDTLYIGGGTPTALSAEQLAILLETLSKHIDIENLREFTIEAGRPDSLNINKLEVMKKYNCSRISINPQSMNDCTLEKIGRKHNVTDVVDKFNMAREAGFNNINMDIIIGLPDENEENVKITMEEIKKLNPESITIHTMSVKRASILNEKQYHFKNDDIINMYDIAVNEISKMNMYPYYMYRQKNMVSPLQNVGYCRDGNEGIYNIQMIAENISILALGADAVSKIVFRKENRIERVANLKDVREYNGRIDEVISKKIIAIDMIEESME